VDVTFITQNILQTDDLGQQFDFIVSNPLCEKSGKQEIKKNVLDNEPHLALFVEDGDALIFYRKLPNWPKLGPKRTVVFWK
jgi:release factor glutamine methyltransferase